MGNIIVLGFGSNDVSLGMSQLLNSYPEGDVLIPLGLGDVKCFRSIVVACKEANRSVKFYTEPDIDGDEYQPIGDTELIICSNPMKEVLRNVTVGDILAIAWDDSIEAHMALHSVEDYGIDIWDITDGLEPIEMDHGSSDDLYEEMQEALTNFVDVFTAYLTAGILETMTKTIDSLIRNQTDGKDINPFGM